MTTRDCPHHVYLHPDEPCTCREEIPAVANLKSLYKEKTPMTTPTENAQRDPVTREDVDTCGWNSDLNHLSERIQAHQLNLLGHLLIDIRERLESIEKAVRESKP